MLSNSELWELSRLLEHIFDFLIDVGVSLIDYVGITNTIMLSIGYRPIDEETLSKILGRKVGEEHLYGFMRFIGLEQNYFDGQFATINLYVLLDHEENVVDIVDVRMTFMRQIEKHSIEAKRVKPSNVKERFSDYWLVFGK